MTRKALRTPDYLDHMLAAIDRIQGYTTGLDLEAFHADTRTQDAVIRNLEVIGEAARNVQQNDPGFVAEHPEVPWSVVYRMRNALSHGYADIDLTTVWNTAKADLPPLKAQLAVLLDLS